MAEPTHILVESLDQLRDLLEPIRAGRVDLAGIDTETTEITHGRFTPWGTSSRIAGASISYDVDGREVDLYVPVRHVPYDWRREARLVRGDGKHDGPEWERRLLVVELVQPEDSPEVEAGKRGAWRPGADPNMDLGGSLELFQEALSAGGTRWIAHNWPFDAKMLEADGLELPWDRMEDTQALSVFTDERPLDAWDEDEGQFVHQGHALKHLGETFLGVPSDAQALLKQAQAAMGPGSEKLMDYSMLPLRSAIAPYACMDTRLVLGLFRVMQLRDAAKDSKVTALYRKHLREVRVSTRMERRGVRVRVDEVPRAVQAQEDAVKRLRLRCTELADRDALPLDHGPSLADVLYSQLGLPDYWGKHDTRKASLKQVRQRLAAGQAEPSGITTERAVQLLDGILDYRRENKLLTAFYRPLGLFTDDGLVHTVLQPLAARTTRFSASAPNMQQAPKPKKGREDESPRRLFVPRDGHSFLFLDYSQIELRLAAHYSMRIPGAFEYLFSWRCTLHKRGDCKGKERCAATPDEKVIHYGWRKNVSRRSSSFLYDGFMSGDLAFDPHQRMADVSGKGRDESKNANFALLYGAFPKKLAETLDVPMTESKRLFDLFWKQAYPELGHLRSFVDERMRKGGKATPWCGQDYLTTLHGARIYLESGYKGLNYLIQRSAREVLLNAILAVDDYLAGERVPYHMLLPVHDELILEAPTDSLDRGVVQSIARTMVDAGAESMVPMVVQPEVAEEDWAHKSELDGWGWNGVLNEAA